MTLTLCLGAGGEQRRRRVVDRDEREHQPRRVMGGELLVEHDLLGGRHAAAPLAGPVRDGVTGRPQLLEPRLLERDELLVGRPGLVTPPAGRDLLAAPAAAPRRETRRAPPKHPCSAALSAVSAVRRRRDSRLRCSSLRIETSSAASPACTTALSPCRCMLRTRLVPCRAGTGSCASRSASVRASDIRSSAAQVRLASPISTAVAAGILSPVNRNSRERRIGVRSGQKAAPPSPATRPAAMCGSAK